MDPFTRFKLFLISVPILLLLFIILWYKEKDEHRRKFYKTASLVLGIICFLTYLPFISGWLQSFFGF